MNSEFVGKNSYRLRKNKRIHLDKADYYVTSSEQTNNFIRDLTVNQEIFLSIPVLTQNYLPSEISPPMGKPLQMSRFNQTFSYKNYLQRLKEANANESKYYNILS